MGRRIRWLGVVMMLCFAAVLVQLVNVQVEKSAELTTSTSNPRNAHLKFENRRGEILASDGTVLAESVPTHSGTGYRYNREYPGGSLYSQIVGYDSTQYGTNGVEYEYNGSLQLHAQPVKTISQYFSPPPPEPDNVTLTVVPALQQAAEQALASIAAPNQDGAVVVLDPQTGAVLAMYSSPTYDPSGFGDENSTSAQAEARVGYLSSDAEGFSPQNPMATRVLFPPGSTSKVVTSSAVYDLKPSLASYSYTGPPCLPLPESNKSLCNDGTTDENSDPCGGTMTTMLPASCDPGYGALGIELGGTLLAKQAAMFGYNSVPPIDLPFVEPSTFPTAAQLANDRLGPPGVAYSSIGQQDVDTSALQDALVAAGIANGGVVMTPHVMAQVRDFKGALVQSYQPTVWKQATTQQTAATVTSLMEGVVTHGTATGCVSTALDAAVKTGTAQTDRPGAPTDDWMIGFAPANDPKVAVAVVSPYQAQSSSGAQVAGPIMNAMLSAATGVPATAGFHCPPP